MTSLCSSADNCLPYLGATLLVVDTEGATGYVDATEIAATGDAATGVVSAGTTV